MLGQIARQKSQHTVITVLDCRGDSDGDREQKGKRRERN